METFTWLSVVVFIGVGVKECSNKKGDTMVGLILFGLAAAIVCIELNQ